ncbi:LOW QUALITY PROTEIN: MAPK/MAK/MRK overlapping kinase [Ammospiza maritima maritima]
MAGEGTFSDVLEQVSLWEGKYCASKHMKQHFESFQSLFLGYNELDHISKIHEVIGTPGNKLQKFKQ